MQNQKLLNIQYSVDTSVKTWITFLLLPQKLQREKNFKSYRQHNDKTYREDIKKKFKTELMQPLIQCKIEEFCITEQKQWKN